MRPCFLSVVYRRNDAGSCDIHLPEEIYVSGNAILSVEHVARYFEYNVMPYEFSRDYTLDIIDDKLNVINLTSTQYIVLHEDETYSITDDTDQ